MAPMPCTAPKTRHLYGTRKKVALRREKRVEEVAALERELDDEDDVLDSCELGIA